MYLIYSPVGSSEDVRQIGLRDQIMMVPHCFGQHRYNGKSDTPLKKGLYEGFVRCRDEILRYVDSLRT